MDALFACGEELCARELQLRLGGLQCNPELARHVGERHADAQVPRRVLEIRPMVERPVTPRDGPLVRGQQRFDGIRRPDVELAFLVFAVGVEAGVETALGRAHVAPCPGDDAARRMRERCIPGRPPGIGVHREQRRIVVEHLLEMRDRPFGVDAVSAETTAELIVDAALGHARERDRGDLECALVIARGVAAQAELELERMRKFRRAAKASVDAVERAREGGKGKLGRIDRQCSAGVLRIRVGKR